MSESTRTIRTPNATVTIRGTLDEVDLIYRATNKALLSSGYTIPKPGQLSSTTTPIPTPDTDFLQRRLNEVERQLADSENHEIIQTMRREMAVLRLECDTYRQAFVDLDANVRTAHKAMTDPTIDIALAQAIVLQMLSEFAG